MSKKQLHKRLANGQVKMILDKYEAGEITTKEAMNYLEIGRTRFYQVIADYEEDPLNFSVDYRRKTSNNRLDFEIEKNILRELKIEKEKIIDNPLVPTNRYNYSYIKDQIESKYGQRISTPTVISRAKKHNFWKPKPSKKIHDTEVITNYAGELLQHDSSHHLFAPDGKLSGI